MNSQFAVILVDSTSHALQIEKLIIKNNLSCKLIPVPRHLSSDCGVCVRVAQSEKLEIQRLLSIHGLRKLTIEDI